MCVCVCTCSTQKALFHFKMSQTRNSSLNQTMPIRLRNRTLITEQGSLQRAGSVPFEGAERISCLHFPSLTATRFMCSPCFCFFPCLSHCCCGLVTGYGKCSTFRNLTASPWSLYLTHIFCLARTHLKSSPLRVIAPPLRFSPPVLCFYYRSQWDFQRDFCLTSSLSLSITTANMKSPTSTTNTPVLTCKCPNYTAEPNQERQSMDVLLFCYTSTSNDTL